MNILFCGNSRAFDGILIAVLSITKYYKGELNIYIFTAGLENMREDYTPICWQQARIIENIVTGVCPQSHVLLIDKTQDFKNELAGWVNKDAVFHAAAVCGRHSCEQASLPRRGCGRLR